MYRFTYKITIMTNKKLALFFTFWVSLEQRKDQGLLDREKLIYEDLIRKGALETIYRFTYGTKDKEIWEKLMINKELNSHIIVIPKPKIYKGIIGNTIYSFLLAIIQKKYIKKCDILKTNQMLGSWSAVIAKILYKKKLIVRTWYTLSLAPLGYFKRCHFISKRIEKITYKYTDYTITTSKKQKDYITKSYKIKKIALLYNYINTNLFKPNRNIKKENDIIYIWRLFSEKNLFNLISAVARTNYNLDLYWAGIQRTELEEHIKKLKKEKQIKLKGKISNKKLPNIINSYKAYVLTSIYEGMPKTLLEAMSCWSACLWTNVMGINEVIKDMKNGILVDKDVESIQDGIEKIMNNHILRNELGNNARTTIESSFSLEIISDKEMEIYKKL